MKRCRVEVSTFCLNLEQADKIARVIRNEISAHSLTTKKDEASSAKSEWKEVSEFSCLSVIPRVLLVQ